MVVEVIKRLRRKEQSKIILLILDGLGGLPFNKNGMTELEAAVTPNLDALATESICGLHEPAGPGITPGSGPGHMALLGYDPFVYTIGRGVLAALGVNFSLQKEDLAVRGNFCTIDREGRVTDRRAGRIPTEKNRQLCRLLHGVQIPGVEIFIETLAEHRFLVVFRGKDLSAGINDTDPMQTGERPHVPSGSDENAKATARIVTAFLEQAKKLLKDERPANMVLLRGFSQLPDQPSFKEVYGLHGGAVAGYPMYRGVARLLGMEVLETDGNIGDEFDVLKKNWDEYDFFFVHVKGTDSAGEDGDFFRKVKVIEELDRRIPDFRSLGPDVLLVTGDHSTPAVMKYHSWHPVPVLLWSRYCRPDQVEKFGERECLAGALGSRFPAYELMPLVMANAGRLAKYGA